METYFESSDNIIGLPKLGYYELFMLKVNSLIRIIIVVKLNKKVKGWFLWLLIII